MKSLRKTLAVVLATAMLLQVGITPAMAKTSADNNKTILHLDELANQQQNITMPLDCKESEVLAKLPEKLTALVATTTYEEVDSGTDSETLETRGG